jgi:hypothetical protein
VDLITPFKAAIAKGSFALSFGIFKHEKGAVVVAELGR